MPDTYSGYTKVRQATDESKEALAKFHEDKLRSHEQKIDDAWREIEEEMRKKNKRQIIAFCLIAAAVSLILLIGGAQQ